MVSHNYYIIVSESVFLTVRPIHNDNYQSSESNVTINRFFTNKKSQNKILDEKKEIQIFKQQ
jgi:hypothetical protein